MALRRDTKKIRNMTSTEKRKALRLKKAAEAMNQEPSTEQVLVQYEAQQCAHISEKDGKKYQCQKQAVGKSTMCLRHNPKAQEHQVQISSTLLPSTRSKFEQKHILGFIRSSQQGKAPVEIAAEFQIAQATLLTWAEKYQDFNDAVEIGKAAYEAFWLQKGRDNLCTKSFSTPLFKFLTGNTLGYSDKVETKSFNTNVHGVLCLPAVPEQTAEEWQKAAMGSGTVPEVEDPEDIVDAEVL